MGVIPVGNSGNPVEVEPGHRAMRAVLRPTDVGSLGQYGVSGVSGLMAAGLAANSLIWSMRYTGANVALIKSLILQAIVNTTAFAAGNGLFQAFIARGFTASDTGGNAVAVAGNGRARTSQGNSGVGDMRIASTAALGAGTRTLDSTPVGSVFVPIPATAVISLVARNTALIRRLPGEWPIVLAQNEGLIIQATVPAAGTWNFSVDAEWEEVSTFGAGLAA